MRITHPEYQDFVGFIDAESARPSRPPLRRTLVELLEQHRGNISHVARDLGRARMQIHRWLQRFELDADAFRG